MSDLTASIQPAPLLRVGHKGADHIAPGNTPASFDAALHAGVDMIEFDVLPEDWREPSAGRLVLAHDYTLDVAAAPSLDEGLRHLASAPFSGVQLDVDLKLRGYERAVVEALTEHGLIERTLISSMYPESLAIVRELEPRLRVGWSVPRVKRDYTSSALYKLPALALLVYARRVLPGRAGAAIAAGEIDAVMSHWRLVTPALVRAVRSANGELYVWTVDDADRIAALERLGVHGVITNDPRLFG